MCCFDECLVQGNAADRQCCIGDHLFPDLDKISTGRKFHQGIGTGKFCLPCLFKFLGDINNIRGCPDGCVDFGAQSFTNPADL